jgi:hypothetical protein
VANLPRFSHRRATVDAAWRQARSWIGVAFPRALDSALTEMRAAFPALAENIDHLRETAEAGALHYQCEPGAGPDAFQAALRAWEAATLDGLAALASARPEASPGHQLDLPQLRKLEASHV